MDWKMKALLFVLVLLGSVVPASAQVPQGYGGVIQTLVVSVSVVFGVVITLLGFWWKFDAKIDANSRETNGKIDRTNDRIDAAKKELKDDAQAAHAAIGTNIDKVHSDIRESEKRVTDNFNKRFDDLRDYIKLAMETRTPNRTGRPSETRKD